VPTTERSVAEVPRILTIGHLDARKNVAAALRALGTVRDLPWRFAIVGGGDARALQDLAEELRLSDRVTFHGHQPDVRRFYEDADLFLFSSRSESLGLVVLEAMSYGLPVVAMRADNRSYFNPFAEILGDTGYLADDESDLGARLRTLLVSGNLAADGARARLRVIDHFTWRAHLDRYDAIFKEIVR